MHAKHFIMSDSLQPHGLQHARLTYPSLSPDFCSNLCPLSVCVCVCVLKLLQSCSTLCDPMDRSPPGSSIHGILQARIPERVATLFQGIVPTQGSNPSLMSPALAGGFFTTSTTWGTSPL